MPLSDRLVAVELPFDIRQSADSVVFGLLPTMIRMLPQLFWKVLAPLPCVSLPF